MAADFEVRRHADPQGVIEDLVAQTTRQAKAIHDLHAALHDLNAALAEAKRLQVPPRSVDDVNSLFQAAAWEDV